MADLHSWCSWQQVSIAARVGGFGYLHDDSVLACIVHATAAQLVKLAAGGQCQLLLLDLLD
jgi:hypothetical protein